MTGPSWQIPSEDAAQAFEDEERHRATHGYCLGSCAHEECHEALEDSDDNEDESEDDE